MQQAEKLKLSGSTDGLGILVVPTATAGTTIHTAVTGTTSYDEIYLYAYNGHTADVVLTVEFGGVTVPNNTIVQTIPFKEGRFLVVDGQILQNEKVVAAFADTANVIVIYGHVHRITK